MYFYNARYYDPALGRFIQADTIVPSPANPQSLNRYSYVYNNPLRYIDPSGHDPNPGVYIWETGQFRSRATSSRLVQFAGEWGTDYRSAVNGAARIIAQRVMKMAQADQAKTMERATLTAENPAAFTSSVSPLWGLSEKATFKAAYGTVTFRRIAGNAIDGWAETHLDWVGNGCSRGQICYDSSSTMLD